MRACQHCGTENDDTRVFCANCGTRLPALGSAEATESPAQASAAPGLPAAGVTAPPLPVPSYRKTKRPPQPAPAAERSATGFLISSLFWLTVVSATLACLIQMVREPDNIPAAVGIDTAAARETFSMLKKIGEAPQPIKWTINSKAINQYLESSIEMKPAEAGLPSLSARFQRAFVKLHTGNLTLYVDQKFLGTNLYFLLNFEPENPGPGLRVRPTGGSIGRLPVHPVMMPVFLRLFEPTIAGLSQPLDLLKKATSVALTPDDATLQWPGTGTKP